MMNMKYIATYIVLAIIDLCLCRGVSFSQLEKAMRGNIFQNWPFKQFASFNDLKLSKKDFEKGIIKDGQWTRKSLKRFLTKIINGKNVNVVVFGSSVSDGAELGPNNQRKTFHYGVANWWNNTIGVIAGSYMKIHRIGLGSSVTSYISRCWKEYLSEKEEVDLLLWEFRLDDQPKNLYKDALESFSFDMMRLQSHPSIFYINFFNKHFYSEHLLLTRNENCANYLSSINTTKSYVSPLKFSWFSIGRLVCTGDRNKLTISDSIAVNHPSFLSHALMSYILISYIQSVFLNVLVEIKSGKMAMPVKENDLNYFYGEGAKIAMSREQGSTVCWTAISLDYRLEPKHSIFNLEMVRNEGFVAVRRFDRNSEEIRYDSLGGYSSWKRGSQIVFKLNLSHSGRHKRIIVSVIFKNKYYGGKVLVRLYDEDTLQSLGSKEADVSKQADIPLTVSEVGTVKKGNYLLSVDSIDKGAVICAISLTYKSAN